MTSKDKNLQLFAGFFDLELLIKKPTCFKGSPSCIDLTITNRAVSLKSQTLKAFPERKLYRDWKTFDSDLKSKIDSMTNLDYSSFEKIFINVLNTHAPIKTKELKELRLTNLWQRLFGKQ